ncbi:hypothetical protein BK126_03200 [Paenibacillus sp. FSL H7-0326]|uniref:helix-turn-helix domain-containing protein n=1 Tax=Paenibacillus sp. FSL H7-0326 TaxID=1921144 RepID=UPI00096C5EDD|nr:helix-turn-helix transcriptional regulator [Paenibacillus sp. FSL H7-0326]OMC71135.1 hypothetical protein BK126_03200 [Paenibacillus sp. FSL H7-0326]
MTHASENRMLIGKRIKEQREAKGLYQDVLAEMIDTKRTNVANYESGTTAPQPYMLVKIAKALNTTVDYLVGATDNPSVRNDTPSETIELSNSDLQLSLDGQMLTPQEIKLITTMIRTTRS